MVYISRYTSEEKANRLKSCNIFPNDIILAKMAEPVARACIIPNITKRFLMASDGIRVDVDKNKHNVLYIVAAINYEIFRRQAINKSTGTTRTRIGLTDLKTINFPIPSFFIQNKIARILTTVDNIIEKTENAIEKYKAIKQGMMHDLFTRGIDDKTGKLRPSCEDAPELYKKTVLGMVPRGWDIGVLNDCCSNFINGGTPSTKKLTYWQGDIPWITGADFLESFQIGFIRRKITNEAVKNSATHVIPEGNILLVTRTGVGKLAIAPMDIAISQDITGLILDSDKTVINYFYYYFQRLVEGFKKMNQGTSINGIIRDDLISCPICVSTTIEQTMIAAKLLRIDNRLKIEQQYLDKQKKIKQGLMQDLLTGKKEVAPDPEDFNRE